MRDGGRRKGAAAATAAAVLWAGLATAETEVERLFAAGDAPGSQERRYVVHVADGLGAGAAAPALVAVLHGCRQTHRDIMEASRFQALADANARDADPTNDFIVVFPFVTRYPPFWIEPRAENCWGWWLDRHRLEGAGEVADLDRLMTSLETSLGTDPMRRYVAGLSSGAAMAVALGVSYSERIAAVGSVAGVPFGETANAVAIAMPYHHAWSFWTGVDANCLDAKSYRSTETLARAMAAEQPTPEEAAPTPLIVIQSTEDCTVEARNGAALAAVWRARYGVDDVPEIDVDCEADGVPCVRRRYDGASGPIVELVAYEGRSGRDTHYWVGDNEGPPFSEADGPSATCLLLAFFGLSPTDASACD